MIQKKPESNSQTIEEYFTYSLFQMSTNIALIGSTGSVGVQTLEVIKSRPEIWKLTTLGAFENVELLERQINEFRPCSAAVFKDEKAFSLKEKSSIPIFGGPESWTKIATLPLVDIVFFASSGVSALPALYAAIKAKKRIALANKEMIVEDGEKIMATARENGVEIIPVDSEHSAVFQCLQGENPADVEKIILTCSGGPFYGSNKADLEAVTVEKALNHPVWKMGAKISVDSATLMNKAFEIIEAKHLFGLHENQIEVVIHPEGVVHSMVQFKDGSIKTQMGVPDMKIPITYALAYPERIQTQYQRVDFCSLSKLTFIKPDFNVFKGPDLARAALKKGGEAPARLRRANDATVKDFLSGKIHFAEIYPRIVSATAGK